MFLSKVILLLVVVLTVGASFLFHKFHVLKYTYARESYRHAIRDSFKKKGAQTLEKDYQRVVVDNYTYVKHLEAQKCHNISSLCIEFISKDIYADKRENIFVYLLPERTIIKKKQGMEVVSYRKWISLLVGYE